jgi:N-acetylmuramoyl-L-alanine amidase
MDAQKSNLPAWRQTIADTIRALIIVTLVGFLVATLFTASHPGELLTSDLGDQLGEALSASEPTATAAWPTPTPRPRPRIGIVAGHSGGDGQAKDPGAVCPEALGGVHEVDVNTTVAALVQQALVEAGYHVDVLEEFDPALEGYLALALVSIHADSCTYVDENATGFKVAASTFNPHPERTKRLTDCLRDRYQKVTNLPWHQSITNDMQYYHAFDEINPDTPAVIIEIGFLNKDNALLTRQPDLVAQGIIAGLMCYLHNEDVPDAP